LLAAGDVDLEYPGAARGGIRHGCAGELPGQDLDPLQEPSLGDPPHERLAVDEVVGVFGLAWPAGPGRPGAAEPEVGNAVQQLVDERALARAAGTEDDEDQDCANVFSSASRCWAPRPRTRLLSLMPISSIRRRARTLPTPGNDSSRVSTFIFPTTSSRSASSRSSFSLVEPIFNFSRSSARRRRAAAAFSSAA